MFKCTNCQRATVDDDDELCDDCQDIQDTLEEQAEFPVGGCPLHEVPGYSRDEFFEMLEEDPSYAGLVDPDDFDIVLIATILRMDAKFRDLMKENQELKQRLGIPV